MTANASPQAPPPTDALDAEERSLIRRHPLPAPIFLPTARIPQADRVAGLRRVLALYEDSWVREHRPRLAALRNRHAGRRMFVLGNGPSLGRIDLDSLRNEITIGVNGLFLAFPDTCFRPTYYVVEDHLVAEDRAEALNALPPGMTRLFPINLAYVLESGPDVYWFDHRPRPGYPHSFDVSLDALACTYAGCTVAFTCLQLATFLGARDIVLLGIDLDYSLPADVTRTETYGPGTVGVLDMASDDPNHFHGDYFGKGHRWHDPQVDNMRKAFVSARDRLGTIGVRLINATPGGRLDLVPRRPLEAVLAGRTDLPPRLLVLDLTPPGGLSASGQMKAALMAPWRGGRRMSVVPDATPERFTVHHADGSESPDQDAATVAALVRAFAPDAVYYRPQPSRGHLHPLALGLIHDLRVPLILHLLDDWPALLARTHPLAHQVWETDLRWLAERAAVRLGIGDRMADAFAHRFGGGPWRALANGIDPTDWPERPHAPGLRGPGRSFDLVYAGALSTTMNRDTVALVVRAVDALARRQPDGPPPPVHLTLWVLPPWAEAAQSLAEGRLGVSVTVTREEDPAAYRARLLRADGVLMAAGFGEDSRAHTHLSIANTLPEALASGAAVLGVGPADQATMAALAQIGADGPLLITEPDPAAIQTAIQTAVQRLADDPALTARLGARGRDHALAAYALRPRQEQLEALIRSATEGRRVLSADHPRADGARLDEAALMLALARFQTTAPGHLVDVGAHRGGFLAPFASADWSVLAVEPETANHAALLTRCADWPAVTVARCALSDRPAEGAAFYTSPDSTGVATLSPFLDSHQETDRIRVETLAALLDRHGVDSVDVLKVDTEGWDLRVMLGLDWNRWHPRLVMVEYENAKTLRLGYSLGDLVAVLEGHGYTVLVSEWHPVLRYGLRHDWRRLTVWPPGDHEPLHDPDGWGNLIAIAPAAGLPDDDALAAMVRAALTVDPRDDAPALAPHAPAARPRPEPSHAPDEPGDSIAPVPSQSDPAQEPAQEPAPSYPSPTVPPGPPGPPPLPKDRWQENPWQENRWYRGLRLLRAMGTVLSGWRAPAAVTLVALAGALPWLPPVLTGPILAGVIAATLGLGAYGSVRAQSLAAQAEDARKQALEARFKRHIGWVRGDMAALGDDIAARLRSLDHGLATLRATLTEDRAARDTALQRLDVALTQDRDTASAALADLRRTLDARLQAQDKALAHLTETVPADLMARTEALNARLTQATQGLAGTIAGLRRDLTRENAARDACWQAAVAAAEQASHRDQAALDATITKALQEEREHTAAALTDLRATIGDPPPQHRIDRLEDRLTRTGALGTDRFQPFARALTDADMARLRTHWLPTLGVPDPGPAALAHLANRIVALERDSAGRLACSLPTAVLRALAAQAIAGPSRLVALEIGVLFGLGLGVLARALEEQPAGRLRLLGIDPLNGGAYGASDDPITGAHPDAATVRRTLARLGLPRRAVTLIRRASQDPIAVTRARRWAGPNGVSLLILDARHDHAGLTEDWSLYAPLLRPGGLALIDDHGAAPWPDVAPFVTEVAARTPGFSLLGSDWGTAVLRREGP